MSTQRPKTHVTELRLAALAHGKEPESVRRSENAKGREVEFLSAALDLFAERNFASVTIKDIAQVLGVNTALIYYYFDNKTHLFRATIEYAVENAFANMRALEEANDDPAGLISSWLQNHVAKFAEIHRFVKIALDYKGSHEGDPAIEAAITRFYAREHELLSRCIRQGIEQRVFTQADPARMAHFISTFLDGCMVRSVILPDFDLEGAVGDLQAVTFQRLGYRPKKKPTPRRR